MVDWAGVLNVPKKIGEELKIACFENTTGIPGFFKEFRTNYIWMVLGGEQQKEYGV